MLSGETTVGKHPVETVRAMANICEVTEQYAEFDYIRENEKVKTIPMAIAESVVDSANRLDAKLICAATMSGSTAKAISNFKPKAPILALCPDDKTARQLALNWGVHTATLQLCHSTDEVLTESLRVAKESVDLVKDDIVVFTGSFPNTCKSKPTNLMKIEQIKE